MIDLGLQTTDYNILLITQGIKQVLLGKGPAAGYVLVGLLDRVLYGIILVLLFLQHAALFWSTWMMSCIQFLKNEG